MTGQRDRKLGSGWWLGVVAVPVLCCAGTSLVVAFCAGSLTAVNRAHR